MIHVKSLNKYYNKGRRNEQHVLDDINLVLEEKGLVCILGESGSGKTTLLNTIGGLDTFSDGTITVDDTELTKYNPKKIEPIRNDKFDYVFQNYYLLQDYTVGYNVRIALNRFDISEEEKDERVDYVLEMLGMAKYKKKLVSKLSGGQQQRVSIARALVKSPDVIFADEPTGNLDEENTLRTMSILKTISKDCLVLLVTHERRIAEFFADRIIEVCDGRIIKDQVNRTGGAYERSDDSNIYLKELECDEVHDEMVDLWVYHKPKEEARPIKLRAAWKDGKLYIQNGMGCDILIEGIESGVQMLDEERPSLDQEEVDNFDYDLTKMTSKGKAKLPFREIWRMALENIRLMGKKQAFVIAILLVTAVLLSVTMAEFINSVTLDEASIVKSDSHYVRMDFEKVTSLRAEEDQWKVFEFVTENMGDGSYGDLFYQPGTNIYLQGEGFYQMKNLSQNITKYCFVDKKHLKKENIIYGTAAEKRNEIVVDKQVIDQLAASHGVVSSMIDKTEDYLNVDIYVPLGNEKLKIVGISDTEQPAIYVSQNVMPAIDTKGIRIASVDELKAQFPEQFQDLSLNEGEMLMRKGLYDSQKISYEKEGGEDSAVEYIADDYNTPYEITGTFPDELAVDYVLSDAGCLRVRNMMYFHRAVCYLYTDNPDQAIRDMKEKAKSYTDSFRFKAVRPYAEEIAQYQKQHALNFGAKNLITVAIMIISMIMVYFTIKSNAISRSEELTVYRLIGIGRGSILKAYMLEMGLLTCYTSLPAVLVTSGIIKFVGSIPSLEIAMLLPWWSVLLLLAAIYAAHLLISVLPVCGILSKPPATLAVKE